MESAPDAEQLRPGARLDRYELLCPLAYGGMATVWLARFGGKLGFEKLVVVKMILPQFAQDPRFQEMFLDEARIASRIEHPNVARIVDVGEHKDRYYIVMDWIDGDSLSKLARATEKAGAKIPFGLVLRMGADICAGLHAAHELVNIAGEPLHVVHRDVSPQNVLISPTGACVLIDFGVAKARDRVAQDTSAGQLKGKIRYMAPEQALGKEIDRRADLWSVGSMLYELFAGKPAYDGPNEVATLHLLTSGAPAAPLPDSVPESIRNVVHRALAPDREVRFGTARELGTALEAAMTDIGGPAAHDRVLAFSKAYLGDRIATRKRAVDQALAVVNGLRDRENAQVTSMPPPAMSSGHPMVDSPSQNMATTSEPVPQFETLEPPSGASNETLGPAAVEWPPVSVDDGRRRKILVAILAAVCAFIVAGGVAVGFTMKTRRAQDTVADPPPRPSSIATSAAAPPSASVASAPSAAPSESAAADDTTPTQPAPTVQRKISSGGHPYTSPHTTPTSAASARPAPTATATKPAGRDYGF